MDQKHIQSILADLPLGEVRYFDSISSTNDAAAGCLRGDCRDLSIFIADEQTAGRGRKGRSWYTPPGSALAVSLVLKPPFPPGSLLRPRLTALGGLAVRAALLDLGLPALLKWPNDVLVNSRKVAGVLVEAYWAGDRLEGAVVGIGVNVLAGSVPPGVLNFPAASIESELGKPVDRWQLLRSILTHLLELRPLLAASEFHQIWENALAFRGEWVLLDPGEGAPPQEGRVLGLAPDGALLLEDRSGTRFSTRFGDLRLLKP